MSREDHERAWQADKRAVIEAARDLIEDVEDRLYQARRHRQHHRAAARIVRKVYPYDYFDLDDLLDE